MIDEKVIQTWSSERKNLIRTTIRNEMKFVKDDELPRGKLISFLKAQKCLKDKVVPEDFEKLLEALN